MNKNTHPGTHIIRVIGVLFGAFILISFFAPKSETATPTPLSILGDTMFMLFGFVLIIPWRKLKTKSLWMILFSFYVCFSLVFIGGQIENCFWAVREGESLQKLMFPLLTAIFGLIIVIQIPAVLRIKNSNQSFHPIANPPGDPVKEQAAQGDA